ncbi:MAG TPA: hypothetical protein PKM56_15820 [Candidatus Rifleibacterium sp.]|nr:hypothetical protein [Candidatus Rifleibacterium sp.]
MITWKFDKPAFDFQEFVRSMLTHFKRIATTDMTVSDFIWRENANVARRGNPENPTWKDLLAELEDGQQLFFPFAEPNEGKPVRCADGSRVQLAPPGSTPEFTYDANEVVGFALTMTRSRFEFQPACYFIGNDAGRLPSMEKLPVGLFEDKIAAFLNGFKKEKVMDAEDSRPETRKMKPL